MKISTIIPAYNSAPYLRRAVESLLATDDSDLEIVIVDDGSNDATLAIARKLEAEYANIVQVARHADGRNLGVSATRNRGMELSTGELIAFLDADDYVLPHRFRSSREILSNHPNVDGVYQLCAMEFEDAQARTTWWSDEPTFGFRTAIPAERLIMELLRGTCWATSAIVFRRSLLARSGTFDLGRKIAEDCHLWFRMAVAGQLVAGDLSKPVSVYWRNGASAYQPAPELRIDMIRAMTSFWNWMRIHYPDSPQRTEISRTIAEYILNGMHSARSQGQRKLAWQVALESAWRYQPVLHQRRWYGQVARMVLGR